MWGQKELLAFLVLGACRVTSAVLATVVWAVKGQRGKKDSLERVDLRVRWGTLVAQERWDPREPEAERCLLGCQESPGHLGNQGLQDARV